MRSLQYHLRNDEEVREALGTRVKLEEPWYGMFMLLTRLYFGRLISVLGDPWITGKVNTMQGRVDLKFRVKASKGGWFPSVYAR
jgi:cytochrome c oxidase assembly factor 1